jgi:predicted DNA-binding transcriptional regulator YafY
MRRADRLFHLVQLLRTRRFRTAAALATELEVSVRTVYRDVQDLQARGVPIEGEAGVGYRLLKGFELPPLTFREDELEALVLGARMVQAWGDSELASAARSLLTKVENVLPEPLREVLLRAALFAPAFPLQQQLHGDLKPLRHAISDRRKVRFGYARADGEASERTVRPLGLYFWGNRWSLAAYCELREDFRNFRPDRMQRLEVLTEGFDGSDGVDLDAFVRAMQSAQEPESRELNRHAAEEREECANGKE